MDDPLGREDWREIVWDRTTFIRSVPWPIGIFTKNDGYG
jgi:hypothetical protein